MAVEWIDRLIKRAAKVVTAPITLNHEWRRQLLCVRHALGLPLMGLVPPISVGCDSNKTHTTSERYMQSCVNLNNGLALHVGDLSRLASANSLLQQADNLISWVAKRSD